MMDLTPKRVEIGDSVIYQELHDEAVLLDMTTQAYFGLDDVGTVIWKLLLEDGNVESAILKLTRIFDIDEATLRRDTHGLVRDLVAANLLKIQN